MPMGDAKKTLSIIIPTLNEADCIEHTLQVIRDRASSNLKIEIIVVDGGSSDDTRTIVERMGVRVLHEPDLQYGRAFQLNRGAEVASGEILMFCDADSLVPQNFDLDILKVINTNKVVGGAFEFVLDGKEFGLRVVEFINRVRYRIWKRYYGDQGVFVLRTVFQKVGGFPAIKLMESSDFCAAIAKEGALILIKKPMLTSARRFLEGGIYHVLWFDVRMWGLNLVGRDTEKFAKEYWVKTSHS